MNDKVSVRVRLCVADFHEALRLALHDLAPVPDGHYFLNRLQFLELNDLLHRGVEALEDFVDEHRPVGAESVRHVLGHRGLLALHHEDGVVRRFDNYRVNGSGRDTEALGNLIAPAVICAG